MISRALPEFLGVAVVIFERKISDLFQVSGIQFHVYSGRRTYRAVESIMIEHRTGGRAQNYWPRALNDSSSWRRCIGLLLARTQGDIAGVAVVLDADSYNLSGSQA